VGSELLLVPYGALILALPFIFLRGALRTRAYGRCSWVSGWHSCWDLVARRRSEGFSWDALSKS
jgi:hypothetical protein